MPVTANGTCSRWANVTSSVSQGSVLGPLLFLLFVNEIPEEVKSDIKMFADDTKIWRVLRQDADTQGLQEDLDTLTDWSEKWLLIFNAAKCKIMHIGKHNLKAYSMKSGNGRIELETVTREKGLGVLVSDDLKPSSQCKAAAAKAMNALRNIKQSFRYITQWKASTSYTTPT